MRLCFPFGWGDCRNRRRLQTEILNGKEIDLQFSTGTNPATICCNLVLMREMDLFILDAKL